MMAQESRYAELTGTAAMVNDADETTGLRTLALVQREDGSWTVTISERYELVDDSDMTGIRVEHPDICAFLRLVWDALDDPEHCQRVTITSQGTVMTRDG